MLFGDSVYDLTASIVYFNKGHLSHITHNVDLILTQTSV